MFAERIPIFRDENILSATSDFNAVEKCHFTEWKIGKEIDWHGRGSRQTKAKQKKGRTSVMNDNSILISTAN